MRFDAIIFDFDGVIVDSEPGSNQVLADQLTALGLPTTREQALTRYCGHRWSDCVAMIEDQIGRPVPDDFVGTIKRIGKAQFLATKPIVPGIHDFVASHGHRRRAIASSNEKEWLDLCLVEIGLADHFGEHVYSAAAVPRGKPHPDVYEMVAAKLEMTPQQVLVIEDSATGVAAGVAAGMTVVGLLAGGHIADHHAGELADAGAHHLASSYAELDRLIATLEE